MTDVDAGVTLTPEETAFFDSGGKTSPEKVETKAEAPTETLSEKPDEAKEKVSGKEEQSERAEKVVPLAALHEERSKRKGLEQRLRDIELENARYSERFKLVEQAQQTKAPDPSEDPLAYIQQQIPKELDEVNKKLSAYEQRDRQQAAQQQLVARYAQDADQFRTQNADFDQAYKFAVESRVREYQVIGHPNPVAAAQNDEMQIALHAYQVGKNPAEIIYEIAKSRGYQAKEKASEKPAAEKLAQIEKGQAANKSLTSAGGESGAGEMTAKQLLEMPMDEFESWCHKNPAKAKRLMGG